MEPSRAGGESENTWGHGTPWGESPAEEERADERVSVE